MAAGATTLATNTPHAPECLAGTTTGIRGDDSDPGAVPRDLCGLLGRHGCKQTHSDPRQEGWTEAWTVTREKRVGDDPPTEQGAKGRADGVGKSGGSEDREGRGKGGGLFGERKSFPRSYCNIYPAACWVRIYLSLPLCELLKVCCVQRGWAVGWMNREGASQDTGHSACLRSQCWGGGLPRRSVPFQEAKITCHKQGAGVGDEFAAGT